MNKYDLYFEQRQEFGKDLCEAKKFYVYMMPIDGQVYIRENAGWSKINNYDSRFDFELVAIYTIHHPLIMCGSLDDIRSEMIRMVRDDLLARGLADCPAIGPLTWVGEGASQYWGN